MNTVGVIGGGASGFFFAINYAKQYPNHEIIIFEKGKRPLQKVKISGGGRCNVTHACFTPSELIKFYPRGNKELRSIFHQFNPTHTLEWFSDRGVSIVEESDGRMFPISNNSQTIIDCFLDEAQKYGVKIRYSYGIQQIKKENNQFRLKHKENYSFVDKLVVACGSNKSLLEQISNLGIETVSPVPSLFTFNTKNRLFKDISGTSFKNVSIQIKDVKLKESGPLLITHWGVSGPAVLKLSAWGARDLKDLDYKFLCNINWIQLNFEDCLKALKNWSTQHPKKNILNQVPFELTKRFWNNLIKITNLNPSKNWNECGKKDFRTLAENLTNFTNPINGKSTFKDEFVTAGGVNLKEINLKTMESKNVKNLYFCGEILNIDGVTGGFNFQSAWSTAWIAAQSV